jgi:hypothetical protein
MNSGVKIIKRDRTHVLQSSPVRQDEKTGQTSDREIAGTVKNWIAELAQRKRADEHIARTRFLINGLHTLELT